MTNNDQPTVDKEFVAKLLKTTQDLVTQIKKNNTVTGVRLPYFTEKWATAVGAILKHVYTHGEPRLIPIGDHAGQTIRCQWYQAKDYLLKFMDKDGFFAAADKATHAEFIRKRGLLIAPRKQKGILNHIAVVPWRPQLEDFLESAVDMQMFERMSVGLTKEDYQYVADLLEPLEHLFVWHVDLEKDHLKVVRITQTPTEG